MSDGASDYDNFQMPESLQGRGKNTKDRHQKRIEWQKSQLEQEDLSVQGCCLVHARRKFIEPLKEDESYKVWIQMLHQAEKLTGEDRQNALKEADEWRCSHYPLNAVLKITETIAKIYIIESDCRKYGLRPEQITQVRQEGSLILWAKLVEYVQRVKLFYTPSHKIYGAAEYFLNREHFLNRFLLNGLYPLDNSRAEQAVKIIKLGEKNSLFFESIKGAEASALWYCLTETAKASGLIPEKYLTWVFETLAQNPADPKLLRKVDPYYGQIPDTVYRPQFRKHKEQK